MNWKEQPVDTSKLWLNRSLEIQLLLACNFSCVSCDQGSQFSTVSWVKRGTMRMEQLEHFVKEMQDANAYIGRIRLVGGEPSIYRDLIPACELFQSQLVERGHVGKLEIVTNGSHPEKLQPIRPYVRVRVSDDNDKIKHHTANLIHTPDSLGYQGKACSAPWHCGIALCYWGFFPCSSGAGIARFTDDMPRWQRLTLPTCVKPCNVVRETWPDLETLCGGCYHSLRPEDKIKSGTSDPARNAPGEHIKPQLDSWLAGKQSDWRTYGGPCPRIEPLPAYPDALIR